MTPPNTYTETWAEFDARVTRTYWRAPLERVRWRGTRFGKDGR